MESFQSDKVQLFCKTDEMEDNSVKPGTTTTSAAAPKSYDNVFSSSAMPWDGASKPNRSHGISRYNAFFLIGFLILLSVALLVGIIVTRMDNYGSISTMNQQQQRQFAAYEALVNNLTDRLENFEKTRLVEQVGLQCANKVTVHSGGTST